MRSIDQPGRPDCEICGGDGWVCEDHKNEPMSHWIYNKGECGGAGMPCTCSANHPDNWIDHDKSAESEIYEGEQMKKGPLKTVKDELYGEFQNKNIKLFDMVWKCVQLGVEIPMIRLRVDRRSGKLTMDLVGRGR